jgi:translation elongation factor EF-G
MSGTLKNDATLQNFTRGTSERLQHVQVMQGKTATAVAELHAGDIGAIAKLKDSVTGDTLGDKAAPILLSAAAHARAFHHLRDRSQNARRRRPHRRGDPRILEEDFAALFARSADQGILLAGSGQQHIEVVVAKLHKRYHVELTLKPPKVPYRETIRGKADAEGKHKKANRRARTVRRLPRPTGAAAARRGRRVCGRRFRRRDSQELDSLGGKRNSRFRRTRLSGRLPRGGFPRRAVRRQISRRGFVGHGVQDRGFAGVQAKR